MRLQHPLRTAGPGAARHQSTSNNALFPRLRRQRRARILRYHLYTAVVRAVLPCTHETMTIFRGALYTVKYFISLQQLNGTHKPRVISAAA